MNNTPKKSKPAIIGYAIIVVWALIFLPINYFINNISVENYRFVLIYRSLPFFLIPGIILWAIIKGNFKRRNRRNIKKKILSTLPILLLLSIFFMIGINLASGLIEQPVIISGQCKLFRTFGRHQSYAIELDGIKYYTSYRRWSTVRHFDSSCSSSMSGCACLDKVRMTVLTKDKMVLGLEVIDSDLCN